VTPPEVGRRTPAQRTLLGGWDLLFAIEIGKPKEVTNLTNRYFRPLLKLAGLPQIRIDDLRHSDATLMLDSNVNVKTVSEMLGHSHTL
jgi:integrase